ncbi:hypothetical protein [Winogradskyella eximia]|uniref:hypothetical protein n=1 Tax=Winogradskyella eximia TaxID=262006 RepID=UPI0024916C83|nr:hypothetical protein [Winogradskyella eximia]
MINTDLNKIQNNVLLDFCNKVNVKTGELGTYINAYYKGLEFKIYEPTKANPNRRLTIEGSLHKYWNHGAHNFNDFGIMQIHEVIKDLKESFDIDPKNCVLMQLEIGVNIIPPIKTKTILKHCLLNKTSALKWAYTKDEGNYIQIKNQRHYSKFYDKKTHYANKGFKIDNEIMRIEKKWSKMTELNQKGIYTLDDLINYDLRNFKTDLLKMWNNVLYCDFETVKGSKNEFKYSNANWWQSLNYENFKYHRNQLNKLITKNPNNIKNLVSELIAKKCDLLNINTTVINRICKGLKTVVSSSEERHLNRRFCLVTGLNISMQRNDSKLLSHTGLRYYLKTDKKIFIEALKKHLPVKWIDSDIETQIQELAHNIRTIHTNQQRKQERLYKPNQIQLFKLHNL